MVNVAPLLPALVPLATLLWIRAADHSISISRNNWDQEYDYIVGVYFAFVCLVHVHVCVCVSNLIN